ncbi:MAG: hypothetical protein K0B11_14640 [Mariniphaga sp.]|nr:hypothetical protein [Mariniphaga sp.]
MKKLVKIKIILPALLFAALLAVNGKLATKKSDADITLNQLRITNAHASEVDYPCGGVMCRWDYEWGKCWSFGSGSVCYCYCETYIA